MVPPHPPYFQNVTQKTFSIADNIDHRSVATLPQGTTLSLEFLAFLMQSGMSLQ